MEDARSELGIANEPHVRTRMAVTQHDLRGVEAERRDLCSRYCTQHEQLMSAHPSRARPRDLARDDADDNEHCALLFTRERRATQPARLSSERMEAHTLP